MMKRCLSCNGSGRVMGGGMMMADCDNCDGRGKIQEADDELEYLQLKTTDSFKNAIDKIKKIDNTLSDDQAEKIFKDELDRTKDEKPSKKSRK